MLKGILKNVSSQILKKGEEAIEKNSIEIIEKGNKTVDKYIGSKLSEFTNKIFTQSGEKDKVVYRAEVIPNNLSETDLSYDDPNFEQKLNKNLQKQGAVLKGGNPLEMINVVNNFIKTSGEVAKFTEVQKTRRKEIEAQRDILVKKIESDRDIILDYLDKSFDERKENFKQLFNYVDIALEKNDIQQLSYFLQSINQLAASSPFKALTDLKSTQQALNSKSHEWDF